MSNEKHRAWLCLDPQTAFCMEESLRVVSLGNTHSRGGRGEGGGLLGGKHQEGQVYMVIG